MTATWKNAHEPDCPVTANRAALLRDLARDPHDEYLRGAIPEHDAGGDEEAEACECGTALNLDALPWATPWARGEVAAYLEAGNWAAAWERLATEAAINEACSPLKAEPLARAASEALRRAEVSR